MLSLEEVGERLSVLHGHENIEMGTTRGHVENS